MFFIVAEIILILSLAVFILSQVIIPAFQGKALFPLFRKQGRLEMEAAELKQAAVEKELENAIKRQKDSINE